MKTVKIVDLRPLGKSGKLAEATCVVEGKGEFKAKTWTGDGLEVGKEYTVDIEKKPSDYGEETWLKVPRRGGGGGPKSDPQRAENDRRRLELEDAKHQDFLRKWSADREAETERQASIAAQVCLKAAVELACAAGDPSPATVHALTLDLCETLKHGHEAIFRSLKARSAGGL